MANFVHLVNSLPTIPTGTAVTRLGKRGKDKANFEKWNAKTKTKTKTKAKLILKSGAPLPPLLGLS